MNAALRRVAIVAFVLLLILMIAASWIQVGAAPGLNADNRNTRTLYREFGNSRGPIVVDGTPIALSTQTKDAFGFQRQYTDGPLYAPMTGFYSIVFGRSGIEKTQNTILNGTADSLFISRLQDLITGRQPKGASVELTLQAKAQKAAMDALGDQKGAVLALNPSTGAILAMVSTPSFDPNVLAVHDSTKVNKAYQELVSDPEHPLINRALSTVYPPGSTFKLLVTAAALESGKYTAETIIDAPNDLRLPLSNSTLNNFGGSTCSPSAEMSLADALRISCNTAYAQLGMDLGADALEDMANKFGFGTQFEVPMTSAASKFPGDLDAPSTALSAIGQKDVAATPLQMAMVASAIANDGRLMQPYSVATVRNPNLDIVSEASASELARPISSTTAASLTDMMIGVVESGTGTSAQIPGVKVAGKTGTAQTTDKASPHAWFVGFAPADNPEIAIAVIVEHGGSLGAEATGGAVAAPIARKVMQAVIK